MSSEHKRPMVAFLIVLMLGVVVLAGAVRTEAFRGLLVDTVGQVSVAGGHLAPESHPQVTTTSQRTSPAAARPRATGTAVVFTRAGHRAESRASTDRAARGRSATERQRPSVLQRRESPGHASDRVTPPAHAMARVTSPAHAKAAVAPPARARAHGTGKSPGHAGKKGHRDARSDRERARGGHPGRAHGRSHGSGHGQACGHRRH